MKIIVADDEPLNQKLAAVMFRRLGHSVKTVSNGRELVETLERETMEFAFMDIHMPVMGGIEATREIVRRWGPADRPIIIALTATADDNDRKECLAAGMDGFLSKPIRLQTLQETITHWSERRRGLPAAAYACP